MNQVAKDEQLLDIAKDCLQFITNFFEAINVSAVHIYHSALELCPTSSVIRKLYYHQRITCLPRVVIGTPESWTRTIAIYGKDNYDGLCIWSPCGRFVAAQMGGAVDIRNQLTLELITTLQPIETIPHLPRLTSPLAYSPDGCSIACASNNAIIIWDVQTGGVAKIIKRRAKNISLVWSSDGRTICTIGPEDRGGFIVRMYDASSGATLSSGTLLSRDIPHLWTDGESFLVMATAQDVFRGCTINIFKIGSTLTKIRSFTLLLAKEAEIWSFSPTAYRISTSDNSRLRILDIQSSKCLLNQPHRSSSHCFSSDGSHFAACQLLIVRVWKYDSGYYILLGQLPSQPSFDPSLQFSPTLSSILGRPEGILQVWHLRELPTPTDTRRWQFAGLSRSWTHIATAHELENTITITDLTAQNPPQFIDTGMEIQGLVITGNVLLVAGSGQLVAWLLTEEGLVDGVIGDRRVDHGDSIWAISKSTRTPQWQFQVEGQVGFIGLPANALHAYDTETGEVLPTKNPENVQGVFDKVDSPHSGGNYLRFHNLHQAETPPGDTWKTSHATVREGWVKDAEGKHRLWVPVEWRAEWNVGDWRHDITTQFSFLGERPVVIKF